MSYEIRAVTDDEFAQYIRVIGTVFGGAPPDEEIEAFRKRVEMDRTIAVFDGDQIVGTAGAISFQLTVPGLQTLPAAGVTAVTVLPTHRRQGLLRAMMEHQLKDVKERGEPLAILLASESVIYGRFGYGLSTTQATYAIDPKYTRFACYPRDENGRLKLVDKEEASRVLPDVYDRARCLQPGAVSRRAEWWEGFFRDPERWRRGTSERMYVVYQSESGQADGFVTYRIKENWENGFPDNTLILTQLIAATPEARAALWRYSLGVDLVSTVEARTFPIEEPLRWMLTEPRRLRVKEATDFLWTRLVDVPAALGGRRYAAEGSVVFEVEDAFRPENTGRYLLEAEADGATCSRTDREADLTLQVADLGAAYLGGVGFTTLARASRVEEHTPGALKRADAMFACEPQAWCATEF
ncbi:MAG TPA: GNAT family N-acetyltransferase [Chloroflexota bacterium]